MKVWVLMLALAAAAFGAIGLTLADPAKEAPARDAKATRLVIQDMT